MVQYISAESTMHRKFHWRNEFLQSLHYCGNLLLSWCCNNWTQVMESPGGNLHRIMVQTLEK